MKRINVLLMTAAMMITLCSCGKGNTRQEMEFSSANSQAEKLQGEVNAAGVEDAAAASNSEEVQSEESTSAASEEGQNILIAYFSWAENAAQDDIDIMTSASVKAPGNVAQLASWIAEETGGELFSIQVTEPYPADWDDCLARANEEKADNIHPKLVQTLENIGNYDTVYLGYPNWWYSCPMAIHSFLDAHDLSGKQVYLFCSHGSGGLAGSVEAITADIPDAVISKDVFHVYEDDTDTSRENLLAWLESQEHE